MPFGLTTAPATFQRLMDIVLDRYRGDFLACFIDDVLVYSDTFEDHLKHLKLTFQAIESAGLKLNKEKSHFFQRKVTFLGHTISANGNQPDLHNMDKIRNQLAPRTVRQVRGFLGMVSYYRSFIKNYAHVAEPLTALTRKNVKFHWSPNCQKAFEHLRQCITSEPILARPNYDKPFIIATDASNFGIAGILGQLDENGKERIVKCVAKTLSAAERNYSTTEREAYAAVWAITKCRPYLIRKKFQLIVDHSALKWIFNNAIKNSKLARWQLQLAEYNYEVIHKPGHNHTNADALSRLPPRKNRNKNRQ
jgi:hypothetical protein